MNYSLHILIHKLQMCELKLLSLFNKFLFKIYNIKYGKNLQVLGHLYLRIHPNSLIEIGDNFYFTSGKSLNPLSRNIKGCISVNEKAILKIGNNVGISSACLWCSNSITIGNNVKIGGNSILLDTDAHSLNYIDRRKFITDIENTISKPIVIEDDVLIGTQCLILKGVRIGKNSIIGGGSVVTKDIPENCIACGNPAKVVKYLQK